MSLNLFRTAVLTSACLLSVPAAAQDDAAAQAIIAQDPSFAAQALRLVDVPKPSGPAVSLFNGKDLADWDPWLGYADPSVTYLKKPGADPVGAGQGLGTIFKVVEEDGARALYVNGATWGSLVHKSSFSNYHLRLQYKWGKGRYAPRVDLPPNNGLLYHSHGTPGSVYGTWMPAVEFEIMKGSDGMVVPVGEDVRVGTSVGQDKSIVYPHRRFMLGGSAVTVRNPDPAWNVENNRDAELPEGQWNTLDLYILGDRAIHVVNGVPVMMVDHLRAVDAAGRSTPLTSGRIQLQSEGAETYFRNITVEPIKSLPKVLAQ